MNPRADNRPLISEPAQTPAPVRAPVPATGWQRLVRWAVNCWLVFHVSAIIIAPAAVSPSSDVIQAAGGGCHPHPQNLDLNHGYHFFAPEPDDSTLLAFEAHRADGTVVSGRIPNFGIVPRL